MPFRHIQPVLPSRIIPAALRVVGANRAYTDADAAGRLIEDSALRPRAYGPPRLIRRDVRFAAGRVFGWPVYAVSPVGHQPTGRVVYVHGGGWVHEIALAHWQLIAQIAAEARTCVIVPIYPLVPFGTAGEVVPRVAQLVTGSAQITWFSGGDLTAQPDEAHPACLVGDSAGGQIALSAAQVALDAHGARLPRTVLIAPGLDLSLENPDIDDVQPSDPWLGVAGARVLARAWAGDLPIRDPLVSPLFGEMAGLGPVSLYCGTRDILHPDARLLVAGARTAGVDVTFHEAPGLVHVHPLTPTPEGRDARAVIMRELRDALAAPSR